MKEVLNFASSGASVAQKKVDMLIRKIRKMHRQAERRGDPGCAELKNVLARVEEIQSLLKATQPMNWDRLIGIAAFLLELTEWICSSLNCLLIRTRFCGNWFHNKPIAQIGMFVSI